MSADTLRWLTLSQGATRKNVSECNLNENHICT